jgi:hypothetical protein
MRQGESKPTVGGLKMNTVQDAPHPIEDVEELLSRAFGNPTPPTEEILRHKWLESEKAGRDIGLPTALYDWRAKHYADWKLAYLPHAATPAQSRAASSRRASFLARYVLLPLAALWMVANMIEWTTGFDCTDVIPPSSVMWTISVPGQ